MTNRSTPTAWLKNILKAEPKQRFIDGSKDITEIDLVRMRWMELQSAAAARALLKNRLEK